MRHFDYAQIGLELSHHERGEQLSVGPEIVFKYGVPYEWGALHVSDQADSLYGMVPLTSETVPDETIDKSVTRKTRIRADVFVLGPEEYYEQGLGIEADHGSGFEL